MGKKINYQCTWCDRQTPQNGIKTTCICGKPLSVNFYWASPLPKPRTINTLDQTLWRYKNVLPPIQDNMVVTLGEGWTFMTDSINQNGVSLHFKDESVNPTGSFKDRGMSMAVSHAKQYSINEICLPSAGNAGVSAAAYCKAAGIKCHVFLPENIPTSFIAATQEFDANLRLAGTTISEAAGQMRKEMTTNWYDLSTMKEPFRVEGKKTLGYEIAEQLNWTLPNVIIYPTGGGTGLIGMWKAFKEMIKLNWLKKGCKLPRMVVAQSSGCAPIVRSFEDGLLEYEPWNNSHTDALGLNVPTPFGGAWILKTVRESGGVAIMVDENLVMANTLEVNKLCAMNGSCEVGVSWLAFKELVDTGWIKKGEKVVIPITGSADRYI